MNTFCTCLLGIYVLLVLLKLLILNMLCISLLGVYLLSILSQFLNLNMFCICLLDVYVLWFSLFCSTFSVFSFLFLFLSVCISIVICLYFILLSACVSIVICLCFYCYLLVFLWYFAACTSAGIQRVLRPLYSSYHSRHTMCTTAAVHSPKAHTLCIISP